VPGESVRHEFANNDESCPSAFHGASFMKTITRRPPNANKASTGIEGFDEITNGGLPHGRTTLLVGQPGSGKTIFGLRFLVFGAQVCREPGIFVAFEEASKRIVANAEGFGWKLPELLIKKLYIVDAQPQPDLVQTGDFDLSGLLTALEAKAKEMGARRIVFDAIDIMLALLPDATAKRREMYRLHAWLLEREMTAIITAKAGGDEASSLTEHPFTGVTLADIYTAGGDVLMGTLRWEKESAERVANEVAEVAGKLKRVTLKAEEAVLRVKAKSMDTELLAKQVEKTLRDRTTQSRKGELSRGRIRMRELRGADKRNPKQKPENL